MRTRLYVGNLKMYLTLNAEVKQYLSVLSREWKERQYVHTNVVLCPSFVHFSLFSERPAGIRLGAQDMFWEKEGAYTGEVSAPMIRDMGGEYVLLGHSERRSYHGETDQAVRQKVEAAFRGHLIPIVCIGETREERNQGKTQAVLLSAMSAIFNGLPKMQAEKVVLAYEPRWAIGTDETPTTTEIFTLRVLLRKWLTEHFDAATEERVAVIYGGSVKREYLGAVSFEAGMDGVLVGRESSYPSEVVRMADILEKAPAHSQ